MQQKSVNSFLVNPNKAAAN